MQLPSAFRTLRRDCPDHCRALVALMAVLLAVTANVVGCREGRPLAPVGGKVTYQGKPLRFGTVMFQAESGQPATGTIESDGTFQMVTSGEGGGAPVGKNRVRITCFESQDPHKKFAGGGDGPLGKSLIPMKYVFYDTSGITVDMHPGANEPLFLNLTDK